MRPRPGFTLLEVLLALAIGLMLMAVLYAALDVQFRTMRSGEEAMEDARLARGLVNRMAADVRHSLGLLSTDTSTGVSLSTASTTSSGSSMASTGSSGSSTSSSSSSQTNSNGTTTPQFNYGIEGSEGQILLYPTTLPRYSQAAAQAQTGIGDLRPVSYQLASGTGLVRQVYRPTAADGSLEPAGPPEALAAEVVDLHFRYFDATTNQWLTAWDGTTTGPPQAVEITMAIQPAAVPSARVSRSRPPTYYRTVVPILTAAIPQAMIDQQQTGVSP